MIKLEGWIKLHRDILNNWTWKEKPFDKGRAWIDLLLIVNHKENKIMFDGVITTVGQGQKITSLRQLSDRWGWSTKKVKKFLDELQKDKMIDFKCDSKKTLITIENYSSYQSKETEKKHSGNSEETLRKTNKNDKECKKNDKKNIYAQQVEQLWSLYPNKQGKAKAIEKIPKLIEKYGYEKVEDCIKKYSSAVKGWDKKYIKHGSTFFNGGYMDYLDENIEESSIDTRELYFDQYSDMYYYLDGENRVYVDKE